MLYVYANNVHIANNHCHVIKPIRDNYISGMFKTYHQIGFLVSPSGDARFWLRYRIYMHCGHWYSYAIVVLMWDRLVRQMWMRPLPIFHSGPLRRSFLDFAVEYTFMCICIGLLNLHIHVAVWYKYDIQSEWDIFTGRDVEQHPWNDKWWS